jgi:ketosteroid isomerase-like protein
VAAQAFQEVTKMPSDEQLLRVLNDDYVAAMQKGDVERFSQILADDFMCSNPDLSLIDKKTFLASVAPPVKISDLTASEVVIRVLGDFAIIHTHISWRSADGRQREGRYTDDWTRRGGNWLCVSAHVTGEGW